MHLSPDAIVYWQFGLFKLNATIVFTWAIMLVLVVGSKLVTRNLSNGLERSRWQNLLEIVVTAIIGQIKDIGMPQARTYLPFLGTLFLFLATASLATVIPGFEPPTGSLSTTIALALCVFVAIPFFGIRKQGLRGYLRSYIEPTVIMLAHAGSGRASVRQHDERHDDHRDPAHDHAVSLSRRHDLARSAHRDGPGLHLHHPGGGLYRGGHPLIEIEDHGRSLACGQAEETPWTT